MGLSIALHGGPGTGKTTLASTAPGPRLHIDTEGGAEWLAGHVIEWTDLGNLPTAINPETTVTVAVAGDTAMATFQTVYQWLMSGKHPFKSVILDSLTEMQKRLIDKLSPIGGGDPDWTTLLRLTERMVRELKDLKNHPTAPLEAVVFVTGTQQKTTDKVQGPLHPSMTGKMAENLPHFVDVCGHTTLVVNDDQTITTYLQILPGNNIVAKDRTSPPGRAGLSTYYGHTIVNPNIAELLAVLNQQQSVA